MIGFIIRRLIYLVIVLIIITLVTYVIFFAGNSDDLAARFAGRDAGPQEIKDAAIRLGLNHGFWYQYWHYLVGLLHGSFGLDFQASIPINSEIARALPVTVSLVLGAAVLWLLIGIPIGIMSATHPRTLRDRTSTIFALTFLSMPTFVLGLLMLLVFYYYLTQAGFQLVPRGRLRAVHHLTGPMGQSISSCPGSPWPWSRPPSTPAWSAGHCSTCWARTTSARPGPRGLRRRTVIYKHGVRAALTPVVTQLGIDVGTLLAGAIVTEQVFGLPGLGQLALNAIENGDLPVVAAVVVLAATFIVVMNTVVDILYAVLDPRVRLS